MADNNVAKPVPNGTENERAWGILPPYSEATSGRSLFEIHGATCLLSSTSRDRDQNPYELL